ncbi:hypothetical protein GUJ93_ZPchr0001g29353 [Zizania palustris]|uniref:Uncharacterized protein n=1 Tax=Zizania palustris TaxID=103762 RepID=A0A8J5RD43_ZIZPA|nr:hypothetical protein GUJ93_ZPchr0001g29353 [Zizania palustris]
MTPATTILRHHYISSSTGRLLHQAGSLPQQTGSPESVLLIMSQVQGVCIVHPSADLQNFCPGTSLLLLNC